MNLTPEEVSLVSQQKFFETKLSATEKLKVLMGEIRSVYLDLFNPSEIYCPEQTDFKTGQIAKGENYEGYPYVLLDLPRYFSKTDIFTFRTMFWYGHAFIFSVILAGERLPHYQQRFQTQYDTLVKADILIGTQDLWDWQDGSFVRLTEQNRSETVRLAETLPFMKLMRHLPPAALADTAGILAGARGFYETIKPVICR